ncbi:hypothetical protein F5Y15DRAFT_321833 [Xylariaceae sp. FL0016]|nr:hypothetical protein F5Y15DRAFT_321833 [Xylariaceae sp. FL0016]
MHHSTFKTAAVALLGLGGSFLGAQAAPTRSGTTGLQARHSGSQTTALAPEIKARDNKTPPNPADSGYIISPGEHDDDLNMDMQFVYSNNYYGGTHVLDSFGWDTGSGRFVVSEARNGDESPQTLKLRDLIVGYWVNAAGQDVANLKSVYYQNIANEDVISSIVDALGKIGQDADAEGTFTVSKDSDDDGQEDAFDSLKDGNPFGAGVDKLVDEYLDDQDAELSSFTIYSRGDEDFDLEVFWKNDD